MRRKDREVTDNYEINKIINSCQIIRLAFADGVAPYIVPLNFGFEEKDGKRTFYFHGAKEGRKLDLIKKLGVAGFEADSETEIYGGREACTYSSKFKSVIGYGKVKTVEDKAEKIHGLNVIMAHYVPGKSFEFNDGNVNAVQVFKLEVREISAKLHS